MAPLPGGLHECRCSDTKRTFQIMMVTVNFLCSQESVYYLVLNCTFPCNCYLNSKAIRYFCPTLHSSSHSAKPTHNLLATAELYTSKECRAKTFTCGHSDCSSNHRLQYTANSTNQLIQTTVTNVNL